MHNLRALLVLITIALAGCLGREPKAGQPPVGAAGSAPVPAFSDAGSEGRVGSDSLQDPPQGPWVVEPSPTAPSDLLLPAGWKVVDIASFSTRPEAAILVQDDRGRSRLLGWKAGAKATYDISTFPDSFAGRSVTVNPARGSVFVAGDAGPGSRIIRFDPLTAGWDSATIYTTHRRIERLVMGSRPFGTDDGVRYRLFLGVRSADGSLSVRTITEGGRLEFQTIGPESTADQYVNIDSFPPARLAVPSAFPMAVHPHGGTLVWRDARGCPQARGYDYMDWGGSKPIGDVGCGGELRFTPNGRDWLQWKEGVGGVRLIRMDGHPGGGPLAGDHTFLTTPVSVPDGRGLIGAERRGERTALVYAPIDVPLADVANAWEFGGNGCDEGLFTRNAGLFRSSDPKNQLYTVYENMHYDGVGTPALATTDLFWENFGTAYSGVFIVLERRRAVPAFKAFVAAADSALRGRTDVGVWPRVFATVAAFYRGDRTGEAGLIAEGEGPAFSAALDTIFDYAELKPRGHYTSDGEMESYFRAMHYLTVVNTMRDAAPLASLPEEVQVKARQWIDGYRPFIASSRADLVWSQSRRGEYASYTRHPWPRQSLFPLSWGADNEALEDGVFHKLWPADQKIWVPTDTMKRRLHPSGLDVALVHGSALARELLRDTLAFYPHLGPVLDAISQARPTGGKAESIYDRWLDAAAVEWADRTPFPGVSSPGLWNAKRLQTGLTTWATLREATILVNERAGAAEMGEGGFEPLISEPPRGYVEPAPQTFRAIANLYDALKDAIQSSPDLDFEPGSDAAWENSSLREAIAARLTESAAEARAFAAMAEKELRGEPLTNQENDQIQSVGGSAEHMFQLYKSLGNPDLALSVPDPMPKIADVAGSPKLGILEVAVGGPLEWHQIVPFFGRRQIAIGSVYSYHEFLAHEPMSNEEWRKEVATAARPEWVRPYVAPEPNACRIAGSR